MNARDIIESGVRAWEDRGGPLTQRIHDAIEASGFALVKLAEKHATDPDWRMDFLNELTDYQAWFASGMFAGRWSDEEFKKILELAKVTFPSVEAKS